MAQSPLESSAVSAFCDGMASMIAAGIQMDEAAHMLAEGNEESDFRDACNGVWQRLMAGDSLADAMAAGGAFPEFAVSLVRTGERAGRTEDVLRNLDSYYDEQDRAFTKLRTSVSYPAALLCIMSVILAFTVGAILPIFSDVYAGISGSLTTGSYAIVGASSTIGWVALVVCVIATALVLVTSAQCRTVRGQNRLLARLDGFGPTRSLMYQVALSRFTMSLSTYLSAGIDTEEAMQAALGQVTNPLLKERAERAYASMTDAQAPLSLAQAISEEGVLEPVYARMLQVGSITGSMDETLRRLSQTFFDDALAQVDERIGRIEPVLAAFLTVTVGATLVAVMLPLVGIMGSLG